MKRSSFTRCFGKGTGELVPFPFVVILHFSGLKLPVPPNQNPLPTYSRLACSDENPENVEQARRVGKRMDERIPLFQCC